MYEKTFRMVTVSDNHLDRDDEIAKIGSWASLIDSSNAVLTALHQNETSKDEFLEFGFPTLRDGRAVLRALHDWLASISPEPELTDIVMPSDEIAVSVDAEFSEELVPFSIPAQEISLLGKSFYAASIAIRDLHRLTTHHDAQRALSRKRRDAIIQYIREASPESPGYFSSAMIVINDRGGSYVTYDGSAFGEVAGDVGVGMLYVDQGCEILVLDGQHRIEALKMAAQSMTEDELDGRLPVVVHTNLSLLQQRQAFADINGNAKAPTSTISNDFDNRNLANRIARLMINGSPIFSGKIDFRATKIGSSNPALWTYTTIVLCTREMLAGQNIPPAEVSKVAGEFRKFWTDIGESAMPVWRNRVVYGFSTSTWAMLALSKLYHVRDSIDISQLSKVDWDKVREIAAAQGGTSPKVAKVYEYLVGATTRKRRGAA